MDVAIDFSCNVSLIRYLDATLVPVRFTLHAELLPTDDVEDIDLDIGFAKIKFWFDSIVSRCVVCSHTNLLAIDMLFDDEGNPRLTNHLMITPEEPNDDHLAVLLQSKMTALAKQKILFGCIRIETDSPTGLVFTYGGDWQDDLPTMADWFDKKPYYFDTPWWERDDVSTLDILPAEEQDFSRRPAWAMSLDFIEDAIRPPPQESVVKGSFRPKVINGGRDGK